MLEPDCLQAAPPGEARKVQQVPGRHHWHPHLGRSIRETTALVQSHLTEAQAVAVAGARQQVVQQQTLLRIRPPQEQGAHRGTAEALTCRHLRLHWEVAPCMR